jgi:hypothetical protein
MPRIEQKHPDRWCYICGINVSHKTFYRHVKTKRHMDTYNVLKTAYKKCPVCNEFVGFTAFTKHLSQH